MKWLTLLTVLAFSLKRVSHLVMDKPELGTRIVQ